MKRIVSRTLAGIVVSALPWLANAQSLSDAQILALNNLQSEFSDCMVFYRISAEGLRQNGSYEAKETAATSELLSERFLMMSYMLGKEISMSEDAMAARIRLATEDQMSSINRNFVNYSVLLERYSKSCKVLYDGFDERVQRAVGP